MNFNHPYCIVLPAILCLLLLSGCASLFPQNGNNVVLRDNSTSKPTVQEIAQGEIIKDLENLHEFALLSAHIYEKSENPEIRCDENKSALTGWVLKEELRIPNFPQKPKWDKKIKGFEYAVWEKATNQPKPLVAIVFRGSDFETGDWFSNLRWVTRFIPFTWDQYDQTRDLIPALIERIHQLRGTTVEIITTGHSLGGGLAQQAAYMSEHIKKVYAYDASTVTGYYSVEHKLREQSKKGLNIYRIYEHGEILAYLRLIMKGLYPIAHENPKIVEVRYNLTRGNFISQHNMKKFACRLKKIHDNKNNLQLQ